MKCASVLESWASRHPYAASAAMVAAVTAFGFAAAPVLHAANIA